MFRFYRLTESNHETIYVFHLLLYYRLKVKKKNKSMSLGNLFENFMEFYPEVFRIKLFDLML